MTFEARLTGNNQVLNRPCVTIITNAAHSIISTVVIRQLRTKEEPGDRKLKFDWLDFINKEPKF